MFSEYGTNYSVIYSIICLTAIILSGTTIFNKQPFKHAFHSVGIRKPGIVIDHGRLCLFSTGGNGIRAQNSATAF